MSTKHKPGLWKNLPSNMVNITVPTTIQSRMTGVQFAKQDNSGVITLVYTDNTTETADCHDIEITEVDNFFSIVSIVQETRTAPA